MAKDINPITIRTAYQWKGEKGEERWSFIRDRIDAVIDELKKSKCKKDLVIHSGRLRARHGASMSSNILQRCKKTDILLFDISDNNPNVFIELGMALAFHGISKGNVFLLKEVDPSIPDDKQDPPVPSDIQGYLITRYTRDENKGSKLRDPQGFRAALKARITDIARQRGMWDVRAEPIVTDSETDPETDPEPEPEQSDAS